MMLVGPTSVPRVRVPEDNGSIVGASQNDGQWVEWTSERTMADYLEARKSKSQHMVDDPQTPISAVPRRSKGKNAKRQKNASD